MTSATTNTAPNAVKAPTVVIENVFMPGPGRPYDVSPDGQRFILVNETRVEQISGPPPQLNFILNWHQELRRLMPHPNPP